MSALTTQKKNSRVSHRTTSNLSSVILSPTHHALVRQRLQVETHGASGVRSGDGRVVANDVGAIDVCLHRHGSSRGDVERAPGRRKLEAELVHVGGHVVQSFLGQVRESLHREKFHLSAQHDERSQSVRQAGFVCRSPCSGVSVVEESSRRASCSQHFPSGCSRQLSCLHWCRTRWSPASHCRRVSPLHGPLGVVSS